MRLEMQKQRKRQNPTTRKRQRDLQDNNCKDGHTQA